MQKVPSKIRRLCTRCKTHQEHAISLISKRQPRAMCFRQRHASRKNGMGSKGRVSKTIATRVKTSKRPHLLAVCAVCTFKTNFTRPLMTKPVMA